MAVNRAQIVDQKFIQYFTHLANLDENALSAELSLNPIDLESLSYSLPQWKLVQLYRSMLSSRLLDIHSREPKAVGESYYTIGASGHECNAAVAEAARPTDPAYLHYRSGAFFIQRAEQHQKTRRK